MAEIIVKGLSDLQKQLSTLAPRLQANVMRSALRAGANVIKEEAKANVPVDSGLLRKGLKVSTRSRRGVVTASVKATGKHSYIARWIEYGTAAHEIVSKNGKSLLFNGKFVDKVMHPGTSPKPFLRPALESKSSAAVVAVGLAIKKRLTTQGLNVADIEVEEQ
jgi:HK97 gp10 family phage protein